MNFKKRLFITLGISSAVCLILIAALFYFGSDISKKASQIEILKIDLASRQEMAQSFANLKQSAETIKNYAAELQNILPSQDKLLSFSKDINIIAKQNKLNMTATLGQQNVQSENGLNQTNFTLVGLGEFDNFIKFLQTLEKSNYFIKLNTFDLNRQADDFNALINGQVFSL